MAWRWYRRIRLFGGLNANLSGRGVGWSWGALGLRFGVSPNGRRWASFGLPGTGLRYFKYLKTKHTGPDCQEESPDTREKPQSIRKWKNLK
ncbi:DUF4236 domain-containing protein [Syntrophotalea acetylenivorans]|uniref:DUF4236 domain-containing protein n=1 Tax=Syntrophotalea acetylenivorans TaxID=1842532 RepID=UPI000931DBAD